MDSSISNKFVNHNKIPSNRALISIVRKLFNLTAMYIDSKLSFLAYFNSTAILTSFDSCFHLTFVDETEFIPSLSVVQNRKETRILLYIETEREISQFIEHTVDMQLYKQAQVQPYCIIHRSICCRTLFTSVPASERKGFPK